METFFFSTPEGVIGVVAEQNALPRDTIDRLQWLFAGALLDSKTEIDRSVLQRRFVGPRREMISPYSTNACDIARNVGIAEVSRIELFRPVVGDEAIDPMLEMIYDELTPSSLLLEGERAAVERVTDLKSFNESGGLALSDEELEYVNDAARAQGRPFTDCELFGFAQINSEHCRHKIFNGEFVIDGKKEARSLFQWIKETSKRAPENLVSAYRDNVAFIKGPEISQFAPTHPETASPFGFRSVRSVVSLKAETHNFPTTVEPFFGAATGSGGEIRDRMAGGRGSLPLSGSAVYMTASPRLRKESKIRQDEISPRKWKYQSPQEILTKASNGASDFGNKFGQPLLNGALLTFEIETERGLYAFDRTVMLAGGVGYGDERSAAKSEPKPGDKLVLLGGDNYRIGMAGGSVSSVDTGKYGEALELSAVQRANPELQKRVYNMVRSLAESAENPVIQIHDHGAGGHMNCFAELLETQGGRIDLDQLPLGDPTLSVREVLSNESQERMGLIVPEESIPYLKKLAHRERAPMYVVGEVTGDHRLVCRDRDGSTPVDVAIQFLIGSSPKTVLEDRSIENREAAVPCDVSDGDKFLSLLRNVLTLEGVGCKDWLTNKVDRCVSGRVAQQQCVGPLQIPLANFGAVLLDYSSPKAICTALGAAPGAGLVSAEAGAILSVAESLTNLVFAPLEEGLKGVVLSANWMWPAKRSGENASLYRAVQACAEFAIELGIAIPTGKDSLSMTMKYRDGQEVRSPGTVIITAVGVSDNIHLKVTPDLKPGASSLLWLDFSGTETFPLGGSSVSQVLGQLGHEAPTVVDAKYFSRAFKTVQQLLRDEALLAGHDVSSGGAIVAVCEMAFSGNVGVTLDFTNATKNAADLFSETPGVILQVSNEKLDLVTAALKKATLKFAQIGSTGGDAIAVRCGAMGFSESLKELRRSWLEPSNLLDKFQTEKECAAERAKTFDTRALSFQFPADFSSTEAKLGISLRERAKSGIRAAVIREQGTNGEREMAFALYAAGFDVQDVTMSDLVSGRENLREMKMIAFPGGFANSDVFGAGKGWAGVFRYNDRALGALEDFYRRDDTLSLSVCNGCQLAMELGLFYGEHEKKISMQRNRSKKFESAFLGVEVRQTESIFLKPLIGSRLGIWVAHGEGQFRLPMGEGAYDLPLRYLRSTYPENPNGSQFDVAGVSSRDGRHLAMMPHLERSLFPANWGFYPEDRLRVDAVSPWILAFRSAYVWAERSR